MIENLSKLKMPAERFTKLKVNDLDLLTFHSSPYNLDELAVGFLYTEGLIDNIEQVKSITVGDGEIDVTAELNEDLEKAISGGVHRTSGCGKGVSFLGVNSFSNFKKNSSPVTFDEPLIFNLMKSLREEARLYKQHGGVHCSALAVRGKIKYLREDIGRHNTVDKIVGRAVMDNLKTDDSVVLTTGRISFEMIAKMAKIGVPLVCSHTAATDLAVQIADELNIDIVGYIRAGKKVVYTSGNHLIETSLKQKRLQNLDERKAIDKC